jgi:hypothetical protein
MDGGSSRLPVIFVFDMDETIIGVSNPLFNVIEFRRFVRDGMKTGKIPTNGRSSINSLQLASILPDQMMRPGFKEAVFSIKKMYPTAEFFLYSAGTAEYVKDVVTWIEKKSGIKFRRPLLSRQQTIRSETSQIVKSLDLHINTMLDILIKDYPALQYEQYRAAVAASRIIHIDDRPDILWEGNDKLITCPAFSYVPFVDVTTGVDPCIVKSELVQEFLKKQNDNDVFIEPDATSTCDERDAEYHIFMAEQFRRIAGPNKKTLQDTFFPTFVKALNIFKSHKKPFTPKNVKKINEAIKQNM